MKNIENWISENKLTTNYKKSAFMVISNTPNPNSDFQISINHNFIDRTNTVKYPGVYLNSDFFWKTHIDYLAKRLSKVCGIIYKLRHFVPTHTLKVVTLACLTQFFNTHCLIREEHVKVTYRNYLFYRTKL